MKRAAKIRLSVRRREAAKLAFKGWTQAAIANHLKVPHGTDSRDLAAMREFWREFPVAVTLMRIKARNAHYSA